MAHFLTKHSVRIGKNRGKNSPRRLDRILKVAVLAPLLFAHPAMLPATEPLWDTAVNRVKTAGFFGSLTPDIRPVSATGFSSTASPPVPSTREIGPAETLDDAWRIALDAGRQLQAKEHEHAATLEQKRAAIGVALPKIANASGRHTISEQYSMVGEIHIPGSGLPPVPFESDLLDRNFTTSVTSLTIPVYMGGRVRGLVEAADAASRAVAAGREISSLDLKYEVANTYFLILRLRHLLVVAEEAETTSRRHEQDAKQRFDHGLVTKNVVLSAQVAVAAAVQNASKVKNAVALSEAAYNRLLDRPLSRSVNIAEISIPPTHLDLDALTAAAMNHRPELAALSHQSRALAAQAKVHRADRLPQVALVGSHNYIQNSHLSTDASFSGSVGMVWIPVDGGVSRHQQRASQQQSLAVTKQYEDARTAIELQVYQCWLDESQSREMIDVAETAVAQADESLRMAGRAFTEGLINHTEVLDAQTQWTAAQTNLANARYDAILATYQLMRATGEL